MAYLRCTGPEPVAVEWKETAQRGTGGPDTYPCFRPVWPFLLNILHMNIQLSVFQKPLHYALLHHDALNVFVLVNTITINSPFFGIETQRFYPVAD